LAARWAQHSDASPFVFPGQGKTGHIVKFRTQFDSVSRKSSVLSVIHDLRRAFTTIAEQIGVPAYVFTKLTNHKFGHPVMRDYIVMNVERLREPMQQITDYMLAMDGLDNPSSNAIGATGS